MDLENVKSCEIEPSWPRGKELLSHFDLVPFLKLPIEFNAAECLDEAKALLTHFVPHRNYDQQPASPSGGLWKSLALRAVGGDSSRTLYHKDYAIDEPIYEMTDVANHCPKTIEFLNRITDPEQCERIRFMLLEPGAKILVHSDAPQLPFAMGVNIALNMPDGCDFFIDVNPDGSHNAVTQKIPFQAGDSIIVNIAKWHYVVNNSDQHRIHIIINGPVRWTPEQMLALARKQNSVIDGRYLTQRLIQKRILKGEHIESGSSLWADWHSMGIVPQSMPANIRIVLVDDPSVDGPQRCHALHHISEASLFPLKHDLITTDQVDTYLNQLPDECDFAVILFAGTWIRNCPQFIIELIRACTDLSSTQALVMGHLMNWPQKRWFQGRRSLPYLHEQFAIVDLRLWRKFDRPQMGRPYSAEINEFPAYHPSVENIHDDYTPLSLQPAPGEGLLRGARGWGTDVLATALANGHAPINVSQGLRSIKKYGYPREHNGWQYQELRGDIQKWIERATQNIFYFNNEPLRGSCIPGFQPEHLISVASGLKPFALIDQYFPHHSPAQITLIDTNPRSLEYISGVSRCRSLNEVANFIHECSVLSETRVIPSVEYAMTRLQEVILKDFNNDNSRFLAALTRFAQTQKLNLCHADFISQPSSLLKVLKSAQPFLFWHSNAWQANVSYYMKSKVELDENYETLLQLTAENTGFHKARRIGYFEALFLDLDKTVRGYFMDHSQTNINFDPRKFM